MPTLGHYSNTPQQLLKRRFMEFNYPSVTPSVVQGEKCAQIVVNEKPLNLVESIFKCKLVQPGNVRDKPELASAIGKFYIDVLDQVEDGMNLVPLKILPERWSLFAPYDPKNNKVLCYSMDGKAPSDKSPEIQSVLCGPNHCDKAKFQGKTPPECQNTVQVILFDLKWKVLVQMDIYRTGMSAWKALNKKYQDTIAKALVLNTPLENFIVKAGANHKGTYIQLTLDLVPAEEELAPYYPVIAYYQNFLERKFGYLNATATETVPVAAAKVVKEEDLGEELPNM